MPIPMPFRRLSRVALAAMLPMSLVLLMPARSAAQAPSTAGSSPATALSFPESPLGRLAGQLVNLVNGGDSVAIARFVDAHVGHDPRGRGPAAMAGMLRAIGQQSGGVSLERVRAITDGVRMVVRARRGDRRLMMEVDAGSDSTHIGEIDVVQLQGSGGMAPPAPWATGRLTDAQIAEVIRDHLRAAADSDRFSGQVVVAHGDRVLLDTAYGYADREHDVRNTRTTTFPVMSLGKMFTSVAIAQLVQQGRLRWDDTVASILPEYPNRSAAARITVRELLTHTAGVPDVFTAPRYRGSHDYGTHLALLADFADAPLTQAPGSHFAYSNGGFATLAAIVEKLSGQPFETYLGDHVWGPSGMTQTARAAGPDTSGRAMGYAHFSELDPFGIDPRRSTASVRGVGKTLHVMGFGGGYYTADDLFRFARALRTGALLRRDLVDTITTAKVTMGGPMKYAFGFFDQEMNGARVVGHSGSNPDTGWDADLEMVWDGDWTVIVLSNYDAPAGMQIEMPILQLLTQQAREGAGG